MIILCRLDQSIVQQRRVKMDVKGFLGLWLRTLIVSSVTFSHAIMVKAFDGFHVPLHILRHVHHIL